jgi:hypothetical protein
MMRSALKFSLPFLLFLFPLFVVGSEGDDSKRVTGNTQAFAFTDLREPLKIWKNALLFLNCTFLKTI